METGRSTMKVSEGDSCNLEALLRPSVPRGPLMCDVGCLWTKPQLSDQCGRAITTLRYPSESQFECDASWTEMCQASPDLIMLSGNMSRGTRPLLLQRKLQPATAAFSSGFVLLYLFRGGRAFSPPHCGCQVCHSRPSFIVPGRAEFWPVI